MTDCLTLVTLGGRGAPRLLGRDYSFSFIDAGGLGRPQLIGAGVFMFLSKMSGAWGRRCWSAGASWGAVGAGRSKGWKETNFQRTITTQCPVSRGTPPAPQRLHPGGVAYGKM